jgi:hypothetical protein
LCKELKIQFHEKRIDWNLLLLANKLYLKVRWVGGETGARRLPHPLTHSVHDMAHSPMSSQLRRSSRVIDKKLPKWCQVLDECVKEHESEYVQPSRRLRSAPDLCICSLMRALSLLLARCEGGAGGDRGGGQEAGVEGWCSALMTPCVVAHDYDGRDLCSDTAQEPRREGGGG